MAGHVTRIGEARNIHKILVGKSPGKHPFGEPKRWESNIKMDHMETGCEDQKWMELAQDHIQ
jgi:hypothetical protein